MVLTRRSSSVLLPAVASVLLTTAPQALAAPPPAGTYYGENELGAIVLVVGQARRVPGRRSKTLHAVRREDRLYRAGKIKRGARAGVLLEAHAAELPQRCGTNDQEVVARRGAKRDPIAFFDAGNRVDVSETSRFAARYEGGKLVGTYTSGYSCGSAPFVLERKVPTEPLPGTYVADTPDGPLSFTVTFGGRRGRDLGFRIPAFSVPRQQARCSNPAVPTQGLVTGGGLIEQGDYWMLAADRTFAPSITFRQAEERWSIGGRVTGPETIAVTARYSFSEGDYTCSTDPIDAEARRAG